MSGASICTADLGALNQIEAVDCRAQGFQYVAGVLLNFRELLQRHDFERGEFFADEDAALFVGKFDEQNAADPDAGSNAT
jgi:hypothetical protein